MALVILLVVPGWHWWSSWWSLGGPWEVGVEEILFVFDCRFWNNLFAISGSATGASQQAHCTRAAGVKSYWQGYQKATQSFLALAGPAWFWLALLGSASALQGQLQSFGCLFRKCCFLLYTAHWNRFITSMPFSWPSFEILGPLGGPWMAALGSHW